MVGVKVTRKLLVSITLLVVTLFCLNISFGEDEDFPRLNGHSSSVYYGHLQSNLLTDTDVIIKNT